MAQKDRCLTPSEIEEQTKRLAADLAFCARRPVNIQLVGGKHIAYTYDTDKTKSTVPIVMNPSILAKVRNKERAIQIWRGIGFHELAHHLWPADQQYKAAHKEGFRHLFNLVDDEQNERLGRAFDASWGACFQSVCALIFPGKEQSDQTLIAGIVDGDKPAKAPRGRAAQKTYIKRWNMFAYHFRRHIPGAPDEVVAAALALIPKRFVDLTKEELLDLTRQIHETLARDIVLPTEDPNAKALPGKEAGKDEEDEDKDEDEQKEDKEPPKPEPEPEPEPEKEPEPEPPAEKDSWSWRKLFRSKWLYLPFGIFVALWGVLLLQGGINFWVKTTINCALILGVVTAFLFIRRAYIKALLARAKAAVSGKLSSAGASAAGASANTKGLIKKTLIGVGAIICAAGAVKFLPLSIAMLAIGMVLSVGCCLLFAQSRKRARENEEPMSKTMIAMIIAASTVAVGIMVFGLKTLGLGDFYLFGIGGLLATILMLGAFFLIADRGQGDAAKPTLWGRIKAAMTRGRQRMWAATKSAIAYVASAIWGLIAAIFIAIWKVIAFCATKTWQALTIAARRLRWKLSGPLTRAWRNPILRVCIVAFPVALILVIIYALLTKAGSYGWWVALILALLLLGGFILAYIFRKQIKKFIVSEMFMPMPQLMDASMQPPLDMVTEWFNQVDNVVPIEPDQESLDALLPEIYPLAQQLRPFLANCGRVSIDREDQPDGYDLTDEAELALVGETAIFINDDSVPKASVHLEVALDCSGSMASPTVSLKPGEKFLLGKFFALVLEQAVLNLPGVSAHFWGFTNDQIYDCGVPGEGRVSGLQCGGGNNDSAMLWHMGQSAAASGKDVKILLMLSDGQPSDCSWLSLHNLVLQFEQEGMIPWNFALDVIKTPAFERFFTDLVGQSKAEAIATMGETLAALAADGI